VGIGVWILAMKITKQHGVPAQVSIYTAEILAIRLTLMTEKKLKISNIIIFTDSKSTIQKLQSNKISPQLVHGKCKTYPVPPKK
jgi:ribonuclease HI